MAINYLLSYSLEFYNQQSKTKKHPIKGFIQIVKVLIFFIGGILLISILINKSPTSLFAGLGASAAILMLVFKDTILGFVAGIQLSANDMLQPGDWITIPNMKIDGIVQEITLNTVKIQNFDNTISTIPPYTLVNGSFQNWRGMILSEGRRVQKNIFLDIQTIKFCTLECFNQLKTEIPLLADFPFDKDKNPTNSQLFRFYIEKYLKSLPIVNTDLDLIISQKQATEYGVPIQIYFFSRNKIWVEYERIQSDIFDHLFAMIPKFELMVYQYDIMVKN
jgi:small-conductance mechanosensitive channel